MFDTTNVAAPRHTTPSGPRGGDGSLQATAEFSPVVLLPTYNNAGTLIDVLDRVEALSLPMIVINDGATDDTPKLLAEWKRRPRSVEATVLTHSQNRGKGAAMKTGFAAARAAGHTHAVTMDTDGQLDPEQIPILLEAAKRSPDALVLGVRPGPVEGCPKANRVGQVLSNAALWLECGLSVTDSQCGLRVYPIEIPTILRPRPDRFGFEAEIITRAAWAGYPIVEVPVHCRYFPDDERVSHFSPLRDGARGFFMQAKLTLRRLVPLPHHGRRRSTPDPNGARSSPVKRLWTWFSPARLFGQIRGSRFEQLIAGIGVGIGAFVASTPLLPLQPLVALYMAKRLHLHPLTVLVGGLALVRPINSILTITSITIGHQIVHQLWVPFSECDPARIGYWEVLVRYPLEWTLGGLILGTILMWLILVAMHFALRLVPVATTDRDKLNEPGGA